MNLRVERERLGLSQAKLAELSKIPRHLLSAFELGKAELPPVLLEALTVALSDKTRVAELASRPKRYQTHQYKEVERLGERVARTAPTEGNSEYVRVLTELSRLHAQNSGEGLSALSLFSGCGGFSLGFSAAGFEIKGFLELNVDLKKIYKSNFPKTIELGGDVTQVSPLALEQFSRNLGRIDVIVGGPPCQGFSLSGKRQVHDPRNVLFKHYLRFVDVFEPKVAILENVRLLTSMKNTAGGFVKDDIRDEFSKHGYEIRCFEINAKNYGVPQHRERVLFVAVRNDLRIAPALPDETHGNVPDLFSSIRPYRTFGDACSDLPYVESGESSDDPLHQAVKHPAHVIDWLWDVQEGFSAHENEEAQLRPPSGYNTTYKRQVWREPASTVQTTFGMISGCRNVHPIATRSLTIREAARIQSFPDSYRFVGNLGTIRTGIGNAVPPLLAYVVGSHLRSALFRLAK